jgi:Ser/Thr protein kinase RdoA (MazF antagonist)
LICKQQPKQQELAPSSSVQASGTSTSSHADNDDDCSNSEKNHVVDASPPTNLTLAAIDFEDVIYGYAVFDVACSLYHLIGGGRRENALCEAFQAGYEQVLPWPEA